MEPEAAFFLLLFVSVIAVIVLASLYSRARGRIKEMERALGISGRQAMRDNRVDESTSDVRIDQLENQVDQIAAQIDRMAESQDFLARVMSSKLDRLVDGRVDTPH